MELVKLRRFFCGSVYNVNIRSTPPHSIICHFLFKTLYSIDTHFDVSTTDKL